ncbi:hypothetical protein [Hydrogenophaga sp.]|uniref:hypothetical protein n=1 Tax=Hydrogenophaga sp. TaxID=1904254 RepID=UPI0035ADAF2F
MADDIGTPALLVSKTRSQRAGNPTARLRVGGSFTTLKPMLANWEERRGKSAEAVVEVPYALLARGADLCAGSSRRLSSRRGWNRRPFARMQKPASRRYELSEATGEIARLEALGTTRAGELSSLRDEHKALELQAAGLKERADQAARLESELRDARAALAKSEQQVATPKPC